MGQRSIRVNELVKRELSKQLHTRFQAEAVYITITSVDVSPDLRSGRVYYSVLGDALKIREAGRFFAKHKESIRRTLGKSIVLKYLPHLSFVYDPGMEHGARIGELLDEIYTENPVH
tara:strand:+ start:28066 stop:28416 length:351 start_codon:yes stop_codon:yes gene_type:complete